MNTDIQLTLLTPARNESKNLADLYERVMRVVPQLGVSWEWIIIDDRSTDSTFSLIEDFARKTPQIKGYRFSRNFGAHAACLCAFRNAKGRSAVYLAADLQDPPELIPKMLEKWKEGNQVVWAVRTKRTGEKISAVGFSKVFHMLMSRLAGLPSFPRSGADFFLLDRKVIQALGQFGESNMNVMALVSWMGFQHAEVEYDKVARVVGESSWSLEKKFKLVVDSITAFTYLPIRLMSYLGFFVAFAGFIYSGLALYNYFSGDPPPGWTTLIIFTLVIGGTQMLMMGVLGEYLWRTLDESRRRPRYIVEDTTFPLENEIR